MDIDPLANLIAGVWTTVVDAKKVRSAADRAIGRAIADFDNIAVRDA